MSQKERRKERQRHKEKDLRMFQIKGNSLKGKFQEKGDKGRKPGIYWKVEELAKENRKRANKAEEPMSPGGSLD